MHWRQALTIAEGKFSVSKSHLAFIASSLLIVTLTVYFLKLNERVLALGAKEQDLTVKLLTAKKEVELATGALNELKREDQYVQNKQLEEEIESIEKTYASAVTVYEDLVKLKEVSKKTDKFDDAFTKVLDYLSKRNYASASATLKTLKAQIQDETAKVSSSFTIPENVATNNTPPASGYRRQKVETPVGSYLVDLVAADLNSTRVVVDTASDADCRDNCPVLALADFVSRSGAFAGINGPYFCPASYPSCTGKTNSFDTLIMNKNKTYFNSDNNIYSTVPAAIFSGNGARFVGQSLEWGRDTGVDAVIASQPLLMINGQRVFGGDGEPKRAGRGARSFIGTTGNTVFIGVVHAASVAEVAYVLETLSIQNALNLDSGGSTALWAGRYIIGPGRNTPYGILFQKK